MVEKACRASLYPWQGEQLGEQQACVCLDVSPFRTQLAVGGQMLRIATTYVSTSLILDAERMI